MRHLWNLSIGALFTFTVLSSLAAANPSLTADFNSDRQIDQVDLSVWRDSYGGVSADADYNGFTDGTDFLIWQRQVGSSSGPPPLHTPEPSALLVWGGLVAIFAVCYAARLQRAPQECD